MGKISLNKLRQGFGELGHSTLFQCYFSDSSLNTIGGELFPAIEVSYDDLSLFSVKVNYGLGVEIEHPVYETPTLKIDLTFLDRDDKALRNAIKKWTAPLQSGKYPDLSNFSKTLTIEDLNISGDVVAKHVFNVYPIGELPYKGDQEFQPDSNILHLQAISSK